jgi:hypothetical protein
MSGPNPNPWREIEPVDYAGGFADNVYTRPLGSLPPRPLAPQRSATGSAFGELVPETGNGYQPGLRESKDPPPRRGAQTPEQRAALSASLRASHARRKAALFERIGIKCPAS